MPQHRKMDPEKRCAHCGKLMKRKRIGARLEDRAVFLKRKYCDRTCMARAYLTDTPTIATLHQRAQKFVGKACEECGTTRNLCVHHMDSNPANNAPGNRKTLCNVCHTTWHWAHGRTLPHKSPPCKICGARSRKLGMCQKHYQRFRKYGDPCLTKRKIGSRYELVREVPGAPNGQESDEPPLECPTESPS
jgi:hypothetical protein